MNVDTWHIDIVSGKREQRQIEQLEFRFSLLYKHSCWERINFRGWQKDIDEKEIIE